MVTLMQRATESRLSPPVTQWVVTALGRLALTAAIVLGFLIILGGEPRFAGPAYSVALTYPGAPESWGVVVGGLGLVGLVSSLMGRLTLIRWTLFGVAVWGIFFAISIWQAALQTPTAGITGVVVYGWFSINAVVLAVAHKR
jgi:hypothetical protein